MNYWSLYIILWLLGIIVGGIGVGFLWIRSISLSKPVVTPTYTIPNSTIKWELVGLGVLLLFIWGTAMSIITNTSKKPITFSRINESPKVLKTAMNIPVRTTTAEERPAPLETPSEFFTDDSTRYYIQVGAFYHYDKAISLMKQLESITKNTAHIHTSTTDIHKVWLGPFVTHQIANTVLDELPIKGFIISDKVF